MRCFRANLRSSRGQVALEYVLAVMVVATVAWFSWVFSQGFLVGNLYGGQELSNLHSGEEWGWTAEIASFGLDKTAALPFP